MNETTEPVTAEAPEGHEYVTIPAMTIHEEVYPTIEVNGEKFLSGRTHLLDPEMAGEVRGIMVRFEKGQLRLLQRNPDRKALKDVPRT